MDELMLGISGMRGTIGSSLTPAVIARYAGAIASHLAARGLRSDRPRRLVVIGRDSRPSGPFVRDIVVGTLVAGGIEVVDLGVVTTPGTALSVKRLGADAGIVITASHNPINWNGVKVLDDRAVAPPPAVVRAILAAYERAESTLAPVSDLRPVRFDTTANADHVRAVLEQVDVETIRRRAFRVVLDSVNGAGGPSGRRLLEELGCTVIHINAEPTGQFTHEPEPTADNLTELAAAVPIHQADIGFAQDPDADRLAIVDERGRYIGEEYTLALAAKFVLSTRPGVVVANLSTSRMIDDIAAMHHSRVVRSPVGEANVVDAMLRENAVIGGEGNGGVIDTRVVPGRDSLISMGYVLNMLACDGGSLSAAVAAIPNYAILKTKFSCTRDQANALAERLQRAFAGDRIDMQDGLRIDWPGERTWVHLRASNTEPIARLIAEAPTPAAAETRIAQVTATLNGG